MAKNRNKNIRGCVLNSAPSIKEYTIKLGAKEHLVNSAIYRYQANYKTETLPPMVKDIFKEDLVKNTLEAMVSPFYIQDYRDAFNKFFNVDLKNRAELTAATTLYREYRGQLEDTGDNPDMFSKDDLTLFTKFHNSSASLTKSNKSLIGLAEASEGYMDVGAVTFALNSSDVSIDSTDIHSIESRILSPVFKNSFDGLDFRDPEDNKEIRRLEDKYNLKVLDKFGVPLLYTSETGLYLVSPYGNKVNISSLTSKHLNPKIMSSLFATIATDYMFSDKAKGKSISLFFHENVLNRYSNNVLKKMHEIAVETENRVREQNEDLDEDELEMLIEDELLDNPIYDKLDNLNKFGNLYKKNAYIRDLMYTQFKAMLSTNGYEVSSDTRSTNEAEVEIDLTEEEEMANEMTIGESFSITSDMISPSKGISPLVQPLLWSIPKYNSNGIVELNPLFNDIEVNVNPSEVANIIRSILVNTYNPMVSTFITDPNSVNANDLYESMYNKLVEFQEANSDSTVGSILNKIDELDSLEEGQEASDFRKAFVDSFMLVEKDYLVTRLNREALDGDTNNSNDFTDAYLSATLNTFDRLNESNNRVLDVTMELINPVYKAYNDEGKVELDMTALNKATKLLTQKDKLPNDYAVIRKSLTDFFGIEFTLDEVHKIDAFKSTVDSTKSLYDRDGTGITVQDTMEGYINGKNKSEKERYAKVIYSNKKNNALLNILNVISESNKFRQSNVHVIGGKKYYGFSEASMITRVFNDMKNVEDGGTFLQKWAGLGNIVADYFLGTDVIDGGILGGSFEKQVRERRDSIKLLEDNALKYEDGEVLKNKEITIADRFIAAFLKWHNDYNYFNKVVAPGSAADSSGVINPEMSSDGNASVSFEGFKTSGVNSVLGGQTFVELGENSSGDQTITFNEASFRHYSKVKLQSELINIHNSMRLIEGYFKYDNRNHTVAELDLELHKFNNPKLLKLKKEDKIKVLKQDYALRNLAAGNYFITNKDLGDMNNQLTYEDFLAGTYHRGNMLNSLFLEINRRNENNEDSPITKIIEYRQDKGNGIVTNKDLQYPKLSDNMVTLMEALKQDTDALNDYEATYEALPIMHDFNELIKGELIKTAETRFDIINKEKVYVSEDKEVTLGHLALDGMDGFNWENTFNDDITIGKAAWMNFIIKTVVFNSEFSAFVSGNINNYKQPKGKELNTVDHSKRMASSNKEVKTSVNRKEYTERVMTTLTGEQKYYNAESFTTFAILEALDNLTSRYLGRINEEVSTITDYTGDIADGVSVATMDYFDVFIRSIKGGWTASDDNMAEKVKDVMNRGTTFTQEHIDWMKSRNVSVIGYAAKTFTFIVDDFKDVLKDPDDGGFSNNIPFMDKTAIIFVSDIMAKNTELEHLLEAMNGQGVSVVSTKSASKASNMASTRIHKTTEVDGKQIFDGLKKYTDDVTKIDNDHFRLNPFIVSNDATGKQQEVPIKGIFMGEVAKQIKKNLRTNLDITSDDAVYFHEGRYKTAKELFETIENLESGLITTQLYKFVDEVLGTNDSNSEDYVNKETKIRELIAMQLDPVKDADKIKALENPNIPITALLNSAQWITPIISSYITKKISQPNTNMGAVVQVADLGYTKFIDGNADNSNIFFFDKENTELKPPLVMRVSDLTREQKETLLEETEKIEGDPIVYFTSEGVPTLEAEGNKKRITKAKVLMPFNDLIKGMEYDEFKALYKEGKIDKRIFQNILSYRIPNQAISSNDSVEIVGVLPPGTSDQMVVYHEITVKTGSDFDIDKLFLMLPSYKVHKTRYLPSEYKKLLEDFSKLDLHLNPLSHYLEPKHDIVSSQYVNELIKNDKNRKILTKLGVIERDGTVISESPLYLIHSVIDELLDNVDIDATVLNKHGNRVNLFAALEDLEDAYTARNNDRAEAIEHAALMGDAMAQEFRQKYSKEAVKSIEYVTNNSTEGMQNRLIEAYNSILESPVTYEDLMTPLDSKELLGVDYLKDTIKNVSFLKYAVRTAGVNKVSDISAELMDELKASYEASKKTSMFDSFSVVDRIISKSDMDASKDLVALTANHMTDIAYTQLMQLEINREFMKLDNNITGKRLQAFHNKNTTISKDGKGLRGIKEVKTSLLVSWFMNSAVDAAKDNYIIEGNFNSYTGNTALMMIRLGMSPEQVFAFLTTDRLMAITRESRHDRSMVNSSPKMYTKESSMDYARALINHMNNKNLSFSDIFSIDALLKEEGDIKTVDDNGVITVLTYGDAIDGAWFMLNSLGKAFNDRLKATKADSEGAGRTPGETIAQRNIVDRIVSDNAFDGGLDTLIGMGDRTGISLITKGMIANTFTTSPELLDRMTSLGMTRNAGLNLLRETLGSVMLEMAPGYLDLVNDISNAFGDRYSTDAQRLDLINNVLYTNLLGYAINPFSYTNIGAKATNEGVEEVREELYKRIMKYKAQFMKGGISDEIFSSEFFENLDSDRATSTVFLRNKMGIEKETILRYKKELELIENTYPNVLNDLMHYAFITSGMKTTMTSLYEFLPDSTIIRNGVGNKLEVIRQSLMTDYTTPFTIDGVTHQINFTDILRDVARVRRTDYRFVKRLGYKVAANVFKPIKGEVNRSDRNRPTYKEDRTSKLKTGNRYIVKDDLDAEDGYRSAVTKDGMPLPAISTFLNGEAILMHLDTISYSGETSIIYEYIAEVITNTNNRYIVSDIASSDNQFNDILIDQFTYKSDYGKLEEYVPSKEVKHGKKHIYNSGNENILVQSTDENLTQEQKLDFILKNNDTNIISLYLGITPAEYKRLDKSVIENLLTCKK